MTTKGFGRGSETSIERLKRPPQVIEMFANLKVGSPGNPPKFYAWHLSYWLRNYAIPRESPSPGVGYHDGNLLSREDAELLDSALNEIFENFAILRPKIGIKKAKKVAAALRRTSMVHWDGRNRKFHVMRVVADPQNYKPFHQCLLNVLRGSRHDLRQETEIGKLAKYFVLFCQSDKKILEELALQYHSATKEEDKYSGILHGRSDD